MSILNQTENTLFDFTPKPDKIHYVYELVRPDGRVFYVGKGQGRRIYAHEQEARRGHKCHKCWIIRKIWRDGGEIGKRYIFSTDNETEAFRFEARVIMAYGLENLANRVEMDPRINDIYPTNPPPKIPKAERERRRQHAFTLEMDWIAGQIRYAKLRRNEEYLEKMLSQQQAYRDALRPLKQQRLEGF